ncbi:MAG TPA: hypothetical protein VNN22_02820 [Verrucomicrobiae bacterium]|nr:hypothetical protein [Verrucomicrobiae bacterium]
MQIKHWLAVGLVLGMEDRKRLGFVLGAQAVLFAGGGVFGVKTPFRLNKLNLDFIGGLPYRDTSPFPAAFVNAGSGEFQLVLANGGELFKQPPLY